MYPDNKSGNIIIVLKFLMEVSLTIDTHPFQVPSLLSSITMVS